jgi:tetratricopeptide (TPR) repeat protein/tRNA A-37 threonylcarbamoyl transferase component Bud32
MVDDDRPGLPDDPAGNATLPATPPPPVARVTPTPDPEPSVNDALATGSVARPSRPDAGAPAADLPILSTVDPGRYAVLDEIARGGMGRIYAARDRKLGRTIAIKELLVSDPALHARFAREAQITARLQHPNIVNLLETGAWPTGEPFYVMKLVAGTSLDQAIATRPTLTDRLGLLPNITAVADALAYAHGKRIIHRDLKPANVLVGEFGETVVIDWGLAKDLTDTTAVSDAPVMRRPSWRDLEGATEVGSVLGTPAYMPAEQAYGEAVDARADVYALGALLYHVLAGAPPYAGKSAAAILDQVTAGPPPSLAARVPGVPADLVAITEKAMAFAAADRYPTAKQLADDLKKFQTGQLVGAHDYTARQLVARWVRRHRTAVAVGGVAVVALAAVGALAIHNVVQEQARTEQQRTLADRNRGDAEGLMSFMLGDLGAKLQPLGRLDLLADVARKAVAYYDGRRDLSDDELGRLAVARRSLGDVLRLETASDLTAALQQYRASLELATGLAARAPGDIQRQRDLADGHDRVGDVLFAQGNAAAALDEYRAAATVRAALPARDDVQRDLVAGHQRIGAVVFARGDVAAALAEYRAALALAEPLAAKLPAMQVDVAACHERIALAIAQQGDPAAALVELRAALAVDDALAAKAPGDADRQRDLATVHTEVGNVLLAQRDAGGALPEYRAALALSEALAANDPTNAMRQRAVSVGHNKLGNVLYKQGDLRGALREYRADLEIAESLAARDPTSADRQADVSVSHNKVGNVLLANSDFAGALAEYRASVAITDALVAKDPSNADRRRALSVGRNKTGDALAASGDTAGALVEYRAAQAIIELLAANDPTNAELQVDVSVSHQRIGDALLATHDSRGALAEYRAGLVVAQQLYAKAPNNADAHEMVDTLVKNVATCCKR